MSLLVCLKYLVALDDHRHFGRAALACHVTRPALSNALKALEDSFGAAIVNRGRNFAGFSAEVQRILVSARRILREHELLQQDLQSRVGDTRGHLIIGAVPSAMPIAARLAAQRGGLDVRVVASIGNTKPTRTEFAVVVGDCGRVSCRENFP